MIVDVVRISERSAEVMLTTEEAKALVAELSKSISEANDRRHVHGMTLRHLVRGEPSKNNVTLFVQPVKMTFFLRGWLSQWYKASMTDEKDVTYNCCEQYMMAQKALLFDDQETFRKIMSEDFPRRQKELGREVKGFDQGIWDKNAQRIVYDGNWLKYTQHEGLRNKLLETQGELVEANDRDPVWSCGLSEYDPDRFDKSKWPGKNWLGEILTQIREKLK